MGIIKKLLRLKENENSGQFYLTPKIKKKTIFSGNRKTETIYSEPLAINKTSVLNQHTKHFYEKAELESQFSKLTNDFIEIEKKFRNGNCSFEFYQKALEKYEIDKNFYQNLKTNRVLSPLIKKYVQDIKNASELVLKKFENGNYNEIFEIGAEFNEFCSIQLQDYKINIEKYNEYKIKKFKEYSDELLADFLNDNPEIFEEDNYEEKIKRIKEKIEYSYFGEVKRQSDRRAINNITQLMRANIGQYDETDKFITLTYSKDFITRGMNREQVKKDVRNFIKRLNRKYNTKIEYIGVFELQYERFLHTGNKVWHVHLSVFNLPFISAPKKLKKLSELEKLIEDETDTLKINQEIKEIKSELKNFWEYGSFDIQGISDSNLSEYLSKYIGKDFMMREFNSDYSNTHRYMRSKNLFNPVVLKGEECDLINIFNEEKETKYYRIDFFNYDHKQFSGIKCQKNEYIKAGFFDDDSKAEHKKNKLSELKKNFNKFVGLLESALENEDLKESEKIVVRSAIDDLLHEEQTEDLIQNYFNYPVIEFQKKLLFYLYNQTFKVKNNAFEYNRNIKDSKITEIRNNFEIELKNKFKNEYLSDYLYHVKNELLEDQIENIDYGIKELQDQINIYNAEIYFLVKNGRNKNINQIKQLNNLIADLEKSKSDVIFAEFMKVGD